MAYNCAFNGEALSHQYIINRSNGSHSRHSSLIFWLLSMLFAHLSTRNHPKATYLPWQKIGLGCGSRWKQACVATKDIVIMNTFEDPEVSNVSPLRAGRTTPTFSPFSVESWKQPPQTQHNEWLGRGRSVFLTTTLYLSPMSPPDLSACNS